MHLHILGICGTFMGGIAAIARQAGHQVTGCDANVYPPMSTQLEAQGIELIEGFSSDQISIKPDLFIIGNVVSRGNPLMEAILDQGLPYQSGPQWLGEQVLQGKHVLAVAGTHGKTTTTAMLTWILQANGLEPGYLIGGVPNNFDVSARLGKKTSNQVDAPHYFVIEADEYDTAFFDKRSKFVHYRPRTAILNNLEFDHADIFADITAIETQFHHLVRTIPASGRLIVNGAEQSVERVVQRGCWSSLERFALPEQSIKPGDWSLMDTVNDGFKVIYQGNNVAEVSWDVDASVTGRHNQLNALAAIAAAHHVGISAQDATNALGTFKNVKRRMEVIGRVNDITIYDDFAHHPTAIATTVEGLRRRVGRDANTRILAVLEPRSNTMKLGVMKSQLPTSLQDADLVFGYGSVTGKDALGWDLKESLAPLGEKAQSFDNLNLLMTAVKQSAKPGDHILVMSNGGFGGVHRKLLELFK
uniref:UDP-N-acetylmuramate:L-alanyl-gamma-D-glutamyl- meso-diaminopimelate ligase n=1 Tax=Polynucleobacter sp. TaxID=2029855 RepID=UPI0040485D7A